MTEYRFEEVDKVPPPGSRPPLSGKHGKLFREIVLRLEQTPSQKWLRIDRSTPMSRQEAKNIAAAVSRFCRVYEEAGFIETKVRRNGSENTFSLYVRRGRTYK